MTERLSEERLAEVLRQIPAEYDDVFQATIREEITEQGLTDDLAILGYLRQRQREFAGGAFLRPDGRRGLVALGGGQLLDEALALGEDAIDPAARRSLILRIAAIAAAAILLFFFLFRGRGEPAEAAAAGDASPTVAAGVTATPEPIQALSGANETLQGIGGLGGSLPLGRPASLELHFSRTGEVVALPIDPSRTTNKGELRYNSGVMAGDDPVAVWLFGTVLNYAIGIPENMVTRFLPGDRIVLQTDTGAAFTFLVGAVETRPNYATNELLRQDRVGMTLFALPAADENGVPVALASYDIAEEEAALAPANRYPMGEPFTVAGVTLAVGEVAYNQTLDGRLAITLTGTVAGDLSGKQLLIGLTSRAEQSETVSLPLDSGAFELAFSLPETVQGATLAADIRLFPGGALATVDLGAAPHFDRLLEISPPTAWLDTTTSLATVVFTVTNPYTGTLRLPTDFIQLHPADAPGAEPLLLALQDTQLPLLLAPGESRPLVLTIMPPESGTALLLTLGRQRWELAGFPGPTSR